MPGSIPVLNYSCSVLESAAVKPLRQLFRSCLAIMAFRQKFALDRRQFVHSIQAKFRSIPNLLSNLNEGSVAGVPQLHERHDPKP